MFHHRDSSIQEVLNLEYRALCVSATASTPCRCGGQCQTRCACILLTSFFLYRASYTFQTSFSQLITSEESANTCTFLIEIQIQVRGIAISFILRTFLKLGKSAKTLLETPHHARLRMRQPTQDQGENLEDLQDHHECEELECQ